MSYHGDESEPGNEREQKNPKTIPNIDHQLIGNVNRRRFLKGSAATLGVGAVPAVGTATGTETSTGGDNGDDEVTFPDPFSVETATSCEGMVVTDHPSATQVGVDVLRNGGNAIDAAVAVQFAMNVVQPHSSGIGGGGFMVIYDADEDELYTVDNRERAPLKATADMFLNEQGEPIPFDKRTTLGQAVGVPGTLRACDLSLKRFGTRPLSELIQPAISLAAPGGRVGRVGPALHEAIVNNKKDFNAAAREVFLQNGKALPVGTKLAQPKLADTFRLIQEYGIEVFYKGKIAKDIADIVQKNGGNMTADDLHRYRAPIDTPEYGPYQDVVVRTQPLPSSGGLTIAQILQLIEEFDLDQFGRRSIETYHALSAAFHLAYADRAEFMGDKELVDAPWQGLLDEEYVDQRRSRIDFESADLAGVEPGNAWDFQPGKPYRIEAPSEAVKAPVETFSIQNQIQSTSSSESKSVTPLAQDRGQTTHFSTADSEGNLVSWTSTIEQFFGTGIMVPEWGFMLNNELTDFDPIPGGPNEVEPTKRPLSSTSPTIVTKDGQPFFTVGSPGGTTIITTVAQIILNVVEFDMSLAEAVQEPRIYNDVEASLVWEPGVPADVRQELRELGHQLPDEQTMLGNVNAILIDPETGEYTGVGDGRRSSAVMGL
jgi:gamma-glutamyltranspeptidase/glutathione hydrolase